MTRRYHVRVEGREEALVVELGPSGAKVDGVAVPLDLESLVEGRFLLRMGDSIRVIDRVSLGSGHYALDAGDVAIDAQVFEERDTWLGVGGAAAVSGVISVAMPGRVVAVQVAEGEAVTKGQRLLIIEAMKMENEVKCPRDGVVMAVRVAAGDAVEAGQALVELELE